jgi:hypothetical protein
MQKMKKLVYSVILVLLSLSASASSVYKIESEIISNNKSLGTPSIIAFANEEATRTLGSGL